MKNLAPSNLLPFFAFSLSWVYPISVALLRTGFSMHAGPSCVDDDIPYSIRQSLHSTSRPVVDIPSSNISETLRLRRLYVTVSLWSLRLERLLLMNSSIACLPFSGTAANFFWSIFATFHFGKLKTYLALFSPWWINLNSFTSQLIYKVILCSGMFLFFCGLYYSFVCRG